MLKQHPKFLSNFAQIIDIFTFIFALFAAFPFRSFFLNIFQIGGEVAIESFYLKKNGRNLTSVLIISTTDVAKRFIESVNQYYDWGLNIVGFLDHQSNGESKKFCNAPVLGDYQSISEVLHAYFIEEVIFAVHSKEIESLSRSMQLSGDQKSLRHRWWSMSVGLC